MSSRFRFILTTRSVQWCCAVAVAAAAALGGVMPANAATVSHEATAAPQAVSCKYQGPIRSDINNYLTALSLASGEPVETAGSTNALSWCVQLASQGGYYLLPRSNEGLCLDGQAQTAGTVVKLWNCNGTQTQRWCWNGAGYLVRPNEHSVAIKDNGRGEAVTLATGNASQWYVTSGSIANSCGD